MFTNIQIEAFQEPLHDVAHRTSGRSKCFPGNIAVWTAIPGLLGQRRSCLISEQVNNIWASEQDTRMFLSLVFYSHLFFCFSVVARGEQVSKDTWLSGPAPDPRGENETVDCGRQCGVQDRDVLEQQTLPGLLLLVESPSRAFDQDSSMMEGRHAQRVPYCNA